MEKYFKGYYPSLLLLTFENFVNLKSTIGLKWV